jgi:mRNA-degrading endonuclease toxin of MazEF toxin-antitoxin module
METFQDYQRELLARRVRHHRQGQRDAGLRPIQIWATDTSSPGFAAECKRQCLAVGESQATGLCPRPRWIALKRGDLVTLEPGRRRACPVIPPARALLVQHDLFGAHEFVAVLPIATQCVSAPLLRVNIGCNQQAKVDQLRMIPRRAIRMVYGVIDAKTQREVDRALALYLGLVR